MEFPIMRKPFAKLPSYSDLILQNHVSNPENYEFKEYEYVCEGKEYKGQHISRIKSLIYTDKRDGKVLVINL